MPHLITIDQALASSGVTVDADNVRAANMALNLLSAKFTQITGLSLGRLEDRSEYFLINAPIVDIDSFGYCRLFLGNGFVDSIANFEVRLGSSKASADSSSELDLTLYSVDYEQGLVSVDVSGIANYSVPRRLRDSPSDKFVVKVIYSSGFIAQQYEIEPSLKPRLYMGIPDWLADVAVTSVSQILKPCGRGDKKPDLEHVMWPMVERAVRYHPLYHTPTVI